MNHSMYIILYRALVYVILLFHFSFALCDAIQNNKVLNYINSIGNFVADFIQHDKHGKTSIGKIIISKPNRLRLQYGPPNAILFIISKKELKIYDYAMDHITRINASDNPFIFFLLNGATDIKKFFNILESSENYLYMMHIETGTLINIYMKKDSLDRITVINSIDEHVDLYFSNIETPGYINNLLFQMYNINAGEQLRQMGLEDLKRYYQ